jgi:hypothetical protein
LKRNRALLAVTVALAIGCVVLSIFVVRLRHQLGRAELYAQSGVDSVSMICAAAAHALREPGDKLELSQIARECVGASVDLDLNVVAAEFSRRDWIAIAERIEAQIKARHLPYMAFGSVEDHLLPQGYVRDR